MDVKCNCPGVSGQCSQLICWKSLSKFRNIGNRLREIYDDKKLTVEVKPVLRRSVAEKVPSYLVLKENSNVKPKKTNLVSVSRSPNYCDEINHLGVPGTVGRKCDIQRTDPLKQDNCEVLCCGRGHNIREVESAWDCQCKFYWCCKVHCERCSEKVIVHNCQ